MINIQTLTSDIKDGSEIKEDSRVSINRDHAAHGSYELVIHKVRNHVNWKVLKYGNVRNGGGGLFANLEYVGTFL